jgi:hypothetical protein
MIINVTFDSSVNNAPAGFVASFNAVVQFFESHFNNPITINIDVGYGEVNGQPLSSGALGESFTEFNNYTYSAIRTALVGNAASAVQMSAASTLPASDPTPGGNGNYYVSTAEAKALGLSGPSSAIDGWVGFASTSSASFTYDTTNGGSVAPGTYDFFGIAAHEISEVLGRNLFVGNQDGAGIGPNSYTPLDLFHYSSNGTRDFLGTTAGYFSFDGGATDVNNFNTNPNGDFGDWASSAGNDAFLAFSGSGHANPVTQADINELNVLGYDAVSTVAAPGTFGVIGDFAGGSDDGIVWESGAQNTPTMWLMNGSKVSSDTTLPVPGPTWQLRFAGDFTGNGMSDLLWQNTNGTPLIWEMNGASIVGGGPLPNPGTAWRLVGTGDFNGDGKDDILLQNTDGQAVIWELNGTSLIGGGALPNPGSAWKAVAVGDFNGDHRADILWQNASGAPVVWEMSGTSIIGGGALPVPGASWSVVGTADITGNGDADILWQNADGTPAIWMMNGASVVGGGTLPNPGSSWKLLGAGDFYGAGDNDLLFVNTSTDQVQIWVMNGAQVASTNTPHTGAASPGSALANALSSSPVLAGPEAFYANPLGSLGATGVAGGGTQLPASVLSGAGRSTSV